MFCSKCGFEISDDDLFCSKCGNKLNNGALQKKNENNLFSEQSLEVIVDRDSIRKGMSIYLNKLLQFEFIMRKLSNDIETLKAEINKQKNELGWKFYPHSGLYNCDDGQKLVCRFSNGISFFVNQENGGFGFQFKKEDNIFNAFLYCGNTDSAYPDTFYDATNGWSYIYYDINDFLYFFQDDIKTTIKKKSFIFTTEEQVDSNTIWNLWGKPIVFGMELNGSDKPLFRNKKQARDLWLKDYEDYNNCKDALISKQTAKIKKQEDLLLSVEKEFESAKKILENFYTLNIIPLKFRSLEAMYSICEYYDSSTESLTSILFHLDMDEIKAKLTNIIDNQQEIIINQAIMIAQNQDIIAQNAATLDKLTELSTLAEKNSKYLAHIEDNTFRAADWASVAASNAEACAWISLSNYLK